MKDISLKDLLEAGCHFGHQVTKWHPSAKKYIYTTRDKIHIIDLAQTKKCLENAADFAQKLAENNKTLVFVGTKRQAKNIIEETAYQAGAHWVSFRWPAGLITNWEEMKKNLDRLDDLEDKIEAEKNKPSLTKKEIILLERKFTKLNTIYSGLRGLKECPNSLFIVDIKKESTAVREADTKQIPTIAIADTNTDPTLINYPIPANDDAVGSIKLIVETIAQAYAAGKKAYKKKSADKVSKDKADKKEKNLPVARQGKDSKKKDQNEKNKS